MTDSAGQPLGNARISISGPASSTTTAKPDGTYTIDVPPGIYSVTIVAPGFEASRNDSVVVAPGQTATLSTSLANVSLTTIGRVRTSVTSVNSAAAASQTLTASAIQSQGQTQVVNVLDQIPGVEIFRTNGGRTNPARTRRSRFAAHSRTNRKCCSTAIRSTRPPTAWTASTRRSSTRS